MTFHDVSDISDMSRVFLLKALATVAGDMVSSKMAADQKHICNIVDVQANAAVSKDAVASLQSFHSA